MAKQPHVDSTRIISETFLQQVVYRDELDSTNSFAVDLCKQSGVNLPDLPALVISERQTSGRGRGSNRWWSAEGALTFSLIVPLAELDGSQLGLVSLCAGLAVCRALERLAPQVDVGLKWPNDVLIHHKKVCGILCEAPPPAGAGSVVIGIGLNVNNSMESAPNELRQSATSLIDQIGTELPLTDVLILCLHELDRCLAELPRSPRDVALQCQAYCCLQGTHVELSMPGGAQGCRTLPGHWGRWLLADRPR